MLASQIWSRRARDFIAFSIVVSLVAGVIALVAGAIVSRWAVTTAQPTEVRRGTQAERTSVPPAPSTTSCRDEPLGSGWHACWRVGI